MSVTAAQASFINASKFAVIGRVLTDQSRWDNKVLRWYIQHDLPVTPVLPPQVTTAGKEAPTEAEKLSIIFDPAQLPDLSNTSISIIIHPAIGIQILKSFFPSSSSSRTTRSSFSSSPRGVWFQPGAESEEIVRYVKDNGLEGRVVCSGECILEEGEDVLRKRQAGGSRL